eukprot:gene3989-1864_t
MTVDAAGARAGPALSLTGPAPQCANDCLASLRKDCPKGTFPSLAECQAC